ncbi:hypothetical protein GGTG_03754 [Gaeumannomyces tritici R3-111a-1]|uniref:Uncharacterized protein n=1 Tax=Gaeumannomyces tritici (strain R3-111a-1) TaxID=644352 RepID=J3NR49_GAET3|nr:hypothetical protein GGTG_03754 [Gaeumannomyces tritici R3-111a-1]EJT78655.1 hypothetical protein GGTG_03754 [Gaeumannomyces tritici R3-111a-1]
MPLLRQPSITGGGYTPAVPSPLNPAICDSIQPKQQSHRRRRIRIAGKTGFKQSPTEMLLRYKAAVAFQDHSAAIERTRELEVRQDLDSECSDAGDLGVRGSSDLYSSKSDKPEAARLPTNGGRQDRSRSGQCSARYAPVPRDSDVADLVLRVVTSGPKCRDPGSNLQKGDDKTTCTTTSSSNKTPALKPTGAALDDGKGQTDVVSEFLVDLSGVTIDTLTTAVFMEQRRTFLAWVTPGRMFSLLALISILFVLVFIRLQALSARYLTP